MNKDKIDSTVLFHADARSLDRIDLSESVAVSRWMIDRNCVEYQCDDSHTLSVYMRGGETSYRVGQAGITGAPGSLCLMPQHQYSNWHINGEIDFFHLNFTDRILKQFAAAHFDTDVRFIELQDVTHKQDDRLKQMLLDYIRLCEDHCPASLVYGEQELYRILDYLLATYNAFRVKDLPVRGGLSPRHMRMVRAAIADRMPEKLSIAGLAVLTGISPFHFARMFKLSFGEPPAQFITRVRIEKVKALLRSDRALAEISYLTGFTHQSHMTSQFKKLTGFTPAAYRREAIGQ